MDKIIITLVAEDLKKLEDKYTKGLVDNARSTVGLYLRKITREAQAIIKSEGYIGTGDLYASVEANNAVIGENGGKIFGELNTGTDYARFIHEGAEHENDTKIVAHYVPFKAAPRLFIWAERRGIIYRKTKKGNIARKSSNKASAATRGSGENWYFTSKKTGKEYPIDVKKGGMMVMTRATKFFEKPFESMKDEFIKDMSNLVGGIE